jgi:valyl-tRNA synthetase
VVADDYSDPEKGTGAVKITPAHDFNDFEVGRRHALPMPSIIDRAGRITLAEIAEDVRPVDGVAEPSFLRALEGEDRFDARRRIVAELERLGLLDRIEPHTHQVPHGDRSGVPIEPLLTVQWYCNAGELAKPAIAAVEQGRTRFVPQQWENTFFAWMRAIQPWCISRQLWWGHRIPAWYGPDGAVFVAHDDAEARAAARAQYGEDRPLVQDEDVLDTWFSSGLWPFSTLGWPERTAELARYYPGDVLVTGFDIIFFWVARMMMLGLHCMGEVPFRDVYIHGLVRDERGQKMSKSKGNVIDPLELIDRYGADALRFTICALAGPGRDIKIGSKRVERHRSFVTKLWNAARFCEMNGIAPDPSFAPAQATLPETRALLVTASDVIGMATNSLESYRFDEYIAGLYRFTWNVFCDWFVEFAKRQFAETSDVAEIKSTAAYVLSIILRLLHPVTPFVTEELWEHFGYGEPYSLIHAPWPKPFELEDASKSRDELLNTLDLVRELRTARAEMNVPPSHKFDPLWLYGASPDSWDKVQRWQTTTAPSSGAVRIEQLRGPVPLGSIQVVRPEGTFLLPLAGVIDLDAERARLRRELEKARRDLAAVERKLDNPDFVTRAAPDVVEEMHDRQVAARAEVARLEAALARIG